MPDCSQASGITIAYDGPTAFKLTIADAEQGNQVHGFDAGNDITLYRHRGRQKERSGIGNG